MKFRVPIRFFKKLPFQYELLLDGYAYYSINTTIKDWFVDEIDYLPTEAEVYLYFDGDYIVTKNQVYEYSVGVYHDLELENPFKLQTTFLVEFVSTTDSLLIPIFFNDSHESKCKVTFPSSGIYKINRIYSLEPDEVIVGTKVVDKLVAKRQLRFWVRPTHKFFVTDYDIQEAVNLVSSTTSS